jgi:L-aspartate oxidase
VVGAGVAGQAAALAAWPLRVDLVTQGSLTSGSASAMALGGIAAAVGPDDSVALHAADTLRAAAGLALEAAVRLMTDSGPDLAARLVEMGVAFDRDAAGRFQLHREAGHSVGRILHAGGDSTGAELVRALTAATVARDRIAVFDQHRAVELATEDGRVVGVYVHDPRADRTVLHRAQAVVIATGGIGQLYASTTNPNGARGDGIAVAARAGAAVGDMEFVQFHPTALATADSPRPLMTEALRGAGAALIDGDGRAIMAGLHPDGDLAPRDVVARGIWRCLQAGRTAYLDARHVPDFAARFPRAHAACLAAGVDPASEPIPVAPAAHYHMGGIATDLDGRSNLAGLYACGEAASTGAHGANRLASNSLLEGLVFGARVGAKIAGRPAAGLSLDAATVPATASAPVTVPARATPAAGRPGDAGMTWARLQGLMWERVGLIRDARGLAAARSELEQARLELARTPANPLRNAVEVALLITLAAEARRESRGAHYRSDFPDPKPEEAYRRLFTAPWATGALDRGHRTRQAA